MNRNANLNRLVMRVARRAEMNERERLAKTFVEVEQITLGLRIPDHQILYGRRGTGKTHHLIHLAKELKDSGDLPIYIDLRTVGSSGGLYADDSQPLAMRGTRLLIDVMEAIYDELLSNAIEEDRFASILDSLEFLGNVVTQVRVEGTVSTATEAEINTADESRSNWRVALKAGSPSFDVGLSSSLKNSSRSKTSVQRTGSLKHQVLFGPLHRALQEVSRMMSPSRIWILLDEWSTLPVDLQPFLADMIRRAFFPCPHITVKISAIERRSTFFQRMSDTGYVGMELGADTAATLNLDEHLVSDAGTSAYGFLAELIFRHMSVLLEQEYQRTIIYKTRDQLINEMFVDAAFVELARAAEGIPRDALNIASTAAARAGTREIRRGDIHWAARQYYLRDKETGIAGNESAIQIWDQLQRKVVHELKSRTFLLKRSSDRNTPALLDLLDARLIHLLRPGLHTVSRPGEVFDGYSVDFGSYVTVLKEAELAAAWEAAQMPWTYRSNEVILLDDFDHSIIFEPSKTARRRAASGKRQRR